MDTAEGDWTPPGAPWSQRPPEDDEELSCP